MKSRIRKIYWIIGIGLVLCPFILAFFSFSFEDKPTIIKTGFNNARVKMLKERYELEIPESAIFISGYYDNAFRDPSIHITFKVLEKDFDALIRNNWKSQDLNIWTGSKEKGYSGMYEYQKEMYTALFYYNPLDGYIKVDFLGRHPGNPQS